MANLTFTFSPRQAAMLADALSQYIESGCEENWPANEVGDLQDEITSHENFNYKEAQDGF